jgi:hypothetical protein
MGMWVWVLGLRNSWCGRWDCGIVVWALGLGMEVWALGLRDRVVGVGIAAWRCGFLGLQE